MMEALQQDSTLIDFASGELGAGISPVQEINALVAENPFTEYLGYDNLQGFVPLREALVSYLHQYRGISAAESSILVTSGSQQSLYLITQCLLTPGAAGQQNKRAGDDPAQLENLQSNCVVLFTPYFKGERCTTACFLLFAINWNTSGRNIEIILALSNQRSPFTRL